MLDANLFLRYRAEDFRAKADNYEHPQTRKTLRNAAKTYDDLANRAEQIRTVQEAAE
jgi:hypothetical protein